MQRNNDNSNTVELFLFASVIFFFAVMVKEKNHFILYFLLDKKKIIKINDYVNTQFKIILYNKICSLCSPKALFFLHF